MKTPCGRPHPVAEGRHTTRRLLPDLVPEMVTVVRNDVRIVELVRRVVAWPSREPGGARDHVLDVLRGHLRPAFDGGHDLDLGSERSHQLKALLAEAIGHHDQRSVALRPADERQCRARAAARVLDDRVAGRDEAVTFGSLDHRERHSILHRTGRVAVLELQPELRAVRRPEPPETDERRVPDRLEDRLHAAIISDRAPRRSA
jgi:hypothetical protein